MRNAVKMQSNKNNDRTSLTSAKSRDALSYALEMTVPVTSVEKAEWFPSRLPWNHHIIQKMRLKLCIETNYYYGFDGR